jgi:co-chaperonin GroES (HSP10)
MQEVKGITIVGFTKEQVANYNQVKLEKAGVTLEVSDYFHPNEHSIEEAVVIRTHFKQTYFNAGDRVLIDFAVFTAGKHKQFEGVSESRFVNSDDHYDYYWLKDPLHPMDVSEIYAVIDEAGNVIPIGDVVIIERKNKEEYIKQGSILIPSEMITGAPFRASVISAPADSIVKPGEEIWCEAGYSPVIKYRGKEITYINYPYIIGRFADNQLQLL